MVKYKQQIAEMLEIHSELFKTFTDIHAKFVQDPKKYQEAFNEEGDRVLRIIRRYENILCAKSESGRYGKFSSNLSEKYWTEIRLLFPKIDRIGMK